MPDHERFEASAWTIRLVAATFWTLAGALPAPATAQSFELEIASIEVEKPRPVAAAVRELAARHGLVITYEDPRWTHASDIEDVTDKVRPPAAPGAVASSEPRLLVPRTDSLGFTYDASDLKDGRRGVRAILERLVEAAGSPFEIRDEGGMFHVVPLEALDAAGRPVPHVSPLDLPIDLPYERRTILETLKAILTAVCGVSDTPVSMGLVWIEPFERLTVETGSQGQTARELLTDTMTVERLKTSWLLFYDPRLEQYFFSVYPVRAPRARPKEG